MVAQKLAGLKLSGVGTAQWLKQKATANWKVVLEMSRYMTIPGAAVDWAEKSERLFKLAWAREDERRAAAGAT